VKTDIQEICGSGPQSTFNKKLGYRSALNEYRKIFFFKLQTFYFTSLVQDLVPGLELPIRSDPEYGRQDPIQKFGSPTVSMIQKIWFSGHS
jgi:hypothetical protein